MREVREEGALASPRRTSLDQVFSPSDAEGWDGRAVTRDHQPKPQHAILIQSALALVQAKMK